MGECTSWFGFKLEHEDCEIVGSEEKESIIYELELAAAVLALWFWKEYLRDNLVTWLGDNDSVRFAGQWAEALMTFHLNAEAELSSKTWFARVPTEAKISDFPSRLCEHPFLTTSLDCSEISEKALLNLKQFVNLVCSHEREMGVASSCEPPSEKKLSR